MGHPIRKTSDVRFNALTVMPIQESSIGSPFGKAVETVKSDSLVVIFKEAASEDVYKYIVVLMIQSAVFCPILPYRLWNALSQRMKSRGGPMHDEALSAATSQIELRTAGVGARQGY